MIELSIGDLVTNAYPPRPFGVYLVRPIAWHSSARETKRFNKSNVYVQKDSIGLVVETIIHHDRQQWACVLIDGQKGWTPSHTLSRLDP